MRHLTRLLPLLLLVPLSAGLAAGCGGGDDSNNPATGPAGQTTNGESTTGTGKNGFEPARGEAKGKHKVTGLSPDAPTYIGRFTRTVSAGEAAEIGGKFDKAGPWTLITGKAVYNVSTPQRAWTGRLRVSGSKMTFTAPTPTKLSLKNVPKSQRNALRRAARSASQPCGSATGTYRWSLQAKKLTFKRISDGCKARRVALSGVWSQRQ
jgi:hypothetical protein